MNDLLIELLSEYKKIENEYVQAILEPDIYPSWDGKRLATYFDGVVHGSYREGDEKTLKAINKLPIEEEIKNQIKCGLKDKIDEILSLTTLSYNNNIELENYKMQLESLKLMDLKSWIEKFDNYKLNLTGNNVDEAIGLTYIYYAYEEYKKTNHSRYNSNKCNLFELYGDKIEQFSKYGLITIGKNRDLLCINPPKIYDKEIEKTLLIEFVPLSLVKEFKKLLDENLIGEISFRVSNDYIRNGEDRLQILLESVERGSILNLDNINEYDVTKLYSNNFNDCLWVIIDDENITFEEICDDFKIYENMITTQVIHLQYTKTEQDTIIKHLDHEYIFYTEDEYEIRLNNPRQKGNAKQRIKSFKIDESCIPITNSCIVDRKDANGDNLGTVKIPFIYFVLVNYFTHKDLLNEYFKNIITN
ncbi:hypothetical protein B2H97_00785 [Paraclostridium bifermentans]|uniref:hypothetical protein n=1 Tax=Paraclostridium bifermentans TaxID=1490 RepID=UPI000A171624|nr:hypothetical protein [Paraclostridium bifermentans]OSB11674.1 hypothetical protein B2H97_00785 [Paraclostridium bifermentans]